MSKLSVPSRQTSSSTLGMVGHRSFSSQVNLLEVSLLEPSLLSGSVASTSRLLTAMATISSYDDLRVSHSGSAMITPYNLVINHMTAFLLLSDALSSLSRCMDRRLAYVTLSSRSYREGRTSRALKSLSYLSFCGCTAREQDGSAREHESSRRPFDVFFRDLFPRWCVHTEGFYLTGVAAFPTLALIFVLLAARVRCQQIPALHFL